MNPLSMTQMGRLSALIRRSPLLADFTVTFGPGEVELVGPRHLLLGLHTLARSVADRPEHEWPDLVDDYLRTALGTAFADPPSTETVMDRVLPRLYAPADPHIRNTTYGRPLAAGLVEVLVVDKPDTIRILDDEGLEEHGGLDTLREAAMRNLRSRQSEAVEETLNGVRVLTGDDHFATWLLQFPSVVRNVFGPIEPTDGVLVAVPSQTMLMVDVLRPGAPAMHTVRTMADMAEMAHDGQPHPISTWVYLWRAGELTALARMRDTKIEVTIGSPEVARFLGVG